MDLTQFDVRSAARAGADLHLKHPATNEPLMCKDGKTPFTVTIAGRDAPHVQDAIRDANRQHTEGKIDEDERGLLVLVSSVIDWCDELEMDGKPLPYSAENARKMLSDERMSWIVEQIVPFSIHRRNFAKNMPNG